MNVSPRYASLLSQVPPLWHGLGVQGPAVVGGSSSSDATSTILEQLESVKPPGHSQEKEPSATPGKQTPPFSHGLGSQISPLQNWGTQRVSPSKSQAATERFMIPFPDVTPLVRGRSGGQCRRDGTAGQRQTPPLTENSRRCLLPAALP